MYEPKLILTSQGLTTKEGRKSIKSHLDETDIMDKKILLIYEPYFSVEKILIDSCKWIGFLEENIYLYNDRLAKDLILDMDYFYVTEGNTFKIFECMKRGNLVELIREAYSKEASYIGASAGSIIAGADIGIAKEFDEYYGENTNFEGLRLVDVIIIPHVSKEEANEKLSSNTLEYLDKSMKNVIFIEDNTSLIIYK